MGNIDPKLTTALGMVIAMLAIGAYRYGSDLVKGAVQLVFVIVFVITVLLLIAWGIQKIFERFDLPSPIDWVRDRTGW